MDQGALVVSRRARAARAAHWTRAARAARAARATHATRIAVGIRIRAVPAALPRRDFQMRPQPGANGARTHGFARDRRKGGERRGAAM
eukprot:4712634-Prymnesium_polylepis.1